MDTLVLPVKRTGLAVMDLRTILSWPRPPNGGQACPANEDTPALPVKRTGLAVLEDDNNPVLIEAGPVLPVEDSGSVLTQPPFLQSPVSPAGS